MRRSFLTVAVAFALLLTCGCALNPAPGTDVSSLPAVDPKEVATGKVACDGWLDEVVKYCQEHPSDNGVLVEMTGDMATAGSAHEEVTTLLLCMPGDGSDDPEKDAVMTPSTPCAEVYFAEPYERTPWRHLIGVRGFATVDSANPNKIIIRGAIESEG